MIALRDFEPEPQARGLAGPPVTLAAAAHAEHCPEYHQHQRPQRHAAILVIDSSRAQERGRAELLKRTFGVDVFGRPNRGGHRRIIAAVTDPDAIKAILAHLGLGAPAPPIAPARAPPSAQLDLAHNHFDLSIDPPASAD